VSGEKQEKDSNKPERAGHPARTSPATPLVALTWSFLHLACYLPFGPYQRRKKRNPVGSEFACA
jgi:hypothetical protein